MENSFLVAGSVESIFLYLNSSFYRAIILPLDGLVLGIGTGRRRKKIREDVDWSLVLDILNCDLRCCILIFCLEWSDFSLAFV